MVIDEVSGENGACSLRSRPQTHEALLACAQDREWDCQPFSINGVPSSVRIPQSIPVTSLAGKQAKASKVSQPICALCRHTIQSAFVLIVYPLFPIQG